MLEFFTVEKSYVLESWVTDADLLFQFGGPDYHYPLNKMQIVDHLYRYPDRKIYYGKDEKGNYYAYGEIIPQEEENNPRIGRILIGNPALRGKGLGKKFINELIEKSVEIYEAKSVELYVLEFNKSAIRCYQKMGFKFLDHSNDVIMKNNQKEFLARKMRLSLE